MRQTEPRLIVVTGADGSGKSTLIRNLASQIRQTLSLNFTIASIWDLRPNFSNIEEYFLTLNSKASTLLIFHALHQSLFLARKEKRDLILFDAYWYKYAVNEAIRGSDFAFLSSLIETLPQPDCVFYLKIPPEKALERKKQLTLYETGGIPDDREKFLSLQHQGFEYWEQFQKLHGPWVHLDAEKSEENLLKEAWNSVF